MAWKYGMGIIAVLLTALAAFSWSDKQLPLSQSPEVFSPGNWIKENQIHVYQNNVTIDLPQARWATFTNTNSMDPFLDADAHALEILPDDAEKIQVGDVIAYSSPYGTIIHRVIAKRYDSQGLYFLVKGDNAPTVDSQKVRFEDVQGVVVAVMY